MAVRNIDVKTLNRWLDESSAVLVDVREPAEYSSRSIPGAYSLPLALVSESTLPEHTGKKLVVHCQSGKRGNAAAEKLLKENPNVEIYNLEGGIAAWLEAGYAVSGAGAFLPLDRQVQLTIGLAVVTGSLLGYYVSPSFFLLSGFFGLGLIFASLTGYCGLARLMAKMPWNRAS